MDIKELERAVNWIDLAQDSDRMPVLVCTVMNLGVRERRGISWLAEDLLVTEALSYMELIGKRPPLEGILSRMNPVCALVHKCFTNPTKNSVSQTAILETIKLEEVKGI